MFCGKNYVFSFAQGKNLVGTTEESVRWVLLKVFAFDTLHSLENLEKPQANEVFHPIDSRDACLIFQTSGGGLQGQLP
jgi:hypothetical protein